MPLRPADAPAVKSRLDALMETYGPVYLDSDPLGLVHRYPREDDREAAAFIAQALAFGNAKAVRTSLGRVYERLGEQPAEALRGFQIEKSRNLFKGIIHRWVSADDLTRFAHMTGAALREWGSLETIFMLEYDPGAATLAGALAAYRGRLLALAPVGSSNKGFSYLLPDPTKGGASKRMHLFLKWMIRRGDGVDLGLWRGPRPGQLTIPLDTHIARIGRLLGLTDRKTPGLKMAEEITDSLRLLCPDDPTRYDFAISRLGILGHCPSRPDENICLECPLQDICRHWRGESRRKTRQRRKHPAPASGGIIG